MSVIQVVLLIRRRCAIYAESNRQLGPVTEEKVVPAGFDGWLTFNFYSVRLCRLGRVIVWWCGLRVRNVRFGIVLVVPVSLGMLIRRMVVFGVGLTVVLLLMAKRTMFTQYMPQ